MPAPINAFATNFELALVFSGVVLLWRYVFSPTARAHTRTPLLVAWDISLSDFFLFLWIVICGGLVFPVVAQQTARALALSAQTKLILVNAGFQGGMLAGVGIYLLCFNRSRSRPSFGFTASILPGIATFLISLPLIVVVGLLWTGLLKLCGLPVEPQDAVAFFKKAQPPALLATMIALAALVAPLTEELVFRGGIFRYARTRLPRCVPKRAPPRTCLPASVASTTRAPDPPTPANEASYARRPKPKISSRIRTRCSVVWLTDEAAAGSDLIVRPGCVC